MTTAPDWMPVLIMTTVLGALIGALGWLIADKLRGIMDFSKALDAKVDKLAERHTSDMERHIEVYHRPPVRRR